MLYHLVPKEYLEAIGDIVVSHNLLEWYLVDLLMVLTGLSKPELRVFAAEMSSRQLRQAATSFAAEKWEKADSESINKLMKRHEHLEKGRNDVVHSVWGSGVSLGQRKATKIKFAAKQGLKLSYQTYGKDELEKLAKDMRILAEDLLDFRNKLNGSKALPK